MLGVSQWRHGAFCVSRQHRLDLFIHRLWKVYHRWITNNSHANDTQAQQVAPNPCPGRFSTETPLERERRLQIQREQRRRRRQQETTEQKEHRLAQRRQGRQQETEEQEIGIRGIMIVLHCRKPRFLSLPVSPPIYRSKSVSALYYGPKNNNFQANCTGPLYLFFVFVFF